MKHKNIEYPHPVLSEYNKDFVESSFSVQLIKHDDDGDVIHLSLNYEVESPGLASLISSGNAKTVVRITCSRTMLRRTYDFSQDRTLELSVSKKEIVDYLDVQGIIVATTCFSNYSLPEFNQEFFESASFTLRKGDILATESGFRIRLNSVLEKDASGIVLVKGGTNIQNTQVHYASIEDEEPDKTDYIYISLPEREYITYHHLRTKKHMKNGIDRFLQASLILPAITEGIRRIQMEEELDEADITEHYIGTVWANSIIDAVRRLYGVDDISSCNRSAYEIADRILGEVVSDSLNNLYQKMEEWSKVFQEDETL